MFYSALAVAETFGKSGKAQIVDVQANSGNIYTPGYAIYESGTLAKVALFNYVTDPSGASDYTVTLSIADQTMPAEVYVKWACLVYTTWAVTDETLDIFSHRLCRRSTTLRGPAR